MSTRSLLHHGFGLGTMEPLRTEVADGGLVFHVRAPLARWRCAHCHSAEVIRRGCRERRRHLVPIGGKPVMLAMKVQRLECRNSGRLAREHLAFAEPRRRYTRQFGRYVLELMLSGISPNCEPLPSA